MSTSKPNAAEQGRSDATARRRHRVIAAINAAAAEGVEISASDIARRAGVDRTFLYRHRDLLAQIHGAQLQSAPDGTATAAHVTRASLQVDLANAQVRNQRLDARNRQLENKLSELLGEQLWRDSGLGAPDDIDQLKRQITNLGQQAVDLQSQLAERDDELDLPYSAAVV
jgi:hypothetical protein